MANKLDVINMALLLAKEEQIADLEDTSKAANTAKAFFNLCISTLISEHDWGFSIQRVILSPDEIEPDFGYTAKFLLPDDFNHIAINTIVETDEEEFDFKIEGQYVHYSADILNLRYCANITNIAIYPPKVVDALTYILASKIADAIASSPEKIVSHLEALYDKRVAKAKTYDPSNIGIPYEVTAWSDTR